MSVALVTGSAGLTGSEASRFFASKGLEVVGVDNDMRRTFFGDEASSLWNCENLESELGKSYRHVENDIRDFDGIERLLRQYGKGGDRFSNCSLIEGRRMEEEVGGRPFNSVYVDTNRIGDHIWRISDLTRFQTHYPQWKLRYDCKRIIREIYAANCERWK